MPSLTIEEIIGRSFIELLPSDYHDMYKQEVKKIFEFKENNRLDYLTNQPYMADVQLALTNSMDKSSPLNSLH